MTEKWGNIKGNWTVWFELAGSSSYPSSSYRGSTVANKALLGTPR